MEEKQANTVSPLNAVLVFIVTMGLSLILGALISVTLGIGAALVISELLLLIIPLGYLLLSRVDVKSYIKFNAKPKLILLGIGFAFILLLVNAFSVAALSAVFGTSAVVEEANASIIRLTQSPEGLIAIVASLSLAGVCEEFLFRGFLQNSIGRKLSFAPTLFLSSLAFGLFHFDPQLVYIISTFIAGLLLGYIYHRWQSYTVSMAAHSTMNLIVLAVLLLTI